MRALVFLVLVGCGCPMVGASEQDAGAVTCSGADLPACVNGFEFYVDPPCQANPYDAGPYCPEGIPCGQASCPHGWTCWGENGGTRFGTCR